jgi:hypothetical protein
VAENSFYESPVVGIEAFGRAAGSGGDRGFVDTRFVFENTIEGLVGQIQPRICFMLALQPGQDTKTLGIAFKPTVRAHEFVQHLFTGVAEGRVPKIVGETGGFD